MCDRRAGARPPCARWRPGAIGSSVMASPGSWMSRSGSSACGIRKCRVCRLSGARGWEGAPVAASIVLIDAAGMEEQRVGTGSPLIGNAAHEHGVRSDGLDVQDFDFADARRELRTAQLKAG